MLIEFDNMPDTSKTWIYQSDRQMNSEEIKDINKGLISFCNTWTTHNKDVHASFKLYPWFICVFVDESKNDASGCSIDKMFNLVKHFSIKYGIDYFNRSSIAFIDQNKIKVTSLSEFKKNISPDTIFFNNLVNTKSQFIDSWKTTVRDSWLMKYVLIDN